MLTNMICLVVFCTFLRNYCKTKNSLAIHYLTITLGIYGLNNTAIEYFIDPVTIPIRAVANIFFSVNWNLRVNFFSVNLHNFRQNLSWEEITFLANVN